jgi:hypothetical protein
MLEMDKTLTVETINTVIGGKPQKALVIISQRIHFVGSQAIFFGIMNSSALSVRNAADQKKKNRYMAHFPKMRFFS